MKKINEQGNTSGVLDNTTPKTQPETPASKLKAYIDNGCIPNGLLDTNTGLGGEQEVAVIVKTKNKNTLYFFPNGKVGKLSPDRKVNFLPETFTCEGVVAPKTDAQKQTELQQNKALQAEINRLIQQNWSLDAPLKSMESLYEKLSEIDPTSYGIIGNKEMYRKKQTGNEQEIVQALETIANSQEVSRRSCKTEIDYYIDAADKNIKIDSELLNVSANKIIACEDQIKNWGPLSSIPDKLRKISSYTGERRRFAINFSENKRLGENKEVKNILKKTLLEVKEQKENLQIESKIVKNRFSMIVEGKTFENDSDYIFESIISEMNYLKAQGYNSKVINEGFFSMLQSIFGNSIKSMPQVFSEYIAQWLMKTLGVPEGTYMGSVVKSLAGNLTRDLSNMDKFFTDCRFTSNMIADSLIEGYLTQLQDEKGLGGGTTGFLVSAIRNAVVDSLAEGQDSIVQKLEDMIADFLCPKISKMANVVSDKADDLKSKVMSA
jgi:hypothetical protein